MTTNGTYTVILPRRERGIRGQLFLTERPGAQRVLSAVERERAYWAVRRADRSPAMYPATPLDGSRPAREPMLWSLLTIAFIVASVFAGWRALP